MQINSKTLPNGLQIIHNEDKTTQMVAVNTLYMVGSRNEEPEHTGFAHLFEHLMFGGSINIPDYDKQCQQASGEKNDEKTHKMPKNMRRHNKGGEYSLYKCL